MHEDRMIARLRQGDPAAQRALYEAHVDRVHRLVYRILGNADEARDAAQQTFIRAFERLGAFRGDSSIGTWLHAIAVSVALNARARLRREAERTAPLDDHHPALEVAPPDDRELAGRLHQAIDRLPERMRIVFIMHELEGYTHAEIAAVLGLAEGSCKAHLAHAREKLRAALVDYAEEWR